MMYNNKFVLSIMQGGHPLREFGPTHNRRVSMPFGSEYKIRVRNRRDRACSARVFVDGAKLSTMGDFVVSANSFVDLERFVLDSMSGGKKLKFVALDHPEVNDPTSGENGVIKVEFRLAKRQNIVIDPITVYPNYPNYPNYSTSDWESTTNSPSDWARLDSVSDGTGGKGFNNIGSSSVFHMAKKSSSRRLTSSIATASPGPSAHTEPGATVEGGHSGQSFSRVSMDFEYSPDTVLKLKIVGIRDEGSITSPRHRHCTGCGASARKKDRYCGSCGKRI